MTDQNLQNSVTPPKRETIIATQGETMASLLDAADTVQVPKVGDVLEGTVIAKNRIEVQVDLGGVLVGAVRGRELFDDAMTFEKLKPGDQILASVLELENENGQVELSLRKAGRKKAWESIRELHGKGEVVSIKIIEANKGGLIAEFMGVQGFLPVSQLAPEHYPRVADGDKSLILDRLMKFIGTELTVKILDFDPAEEKLIFSEKEAVVEDQKELIKKLKVGDRVKGKVTGLVDFGVFVQFDGLEGLVHISEMAWQRIDNPADIVKVGDEIDAEIISIENNRVSLSMKRLVEDPWVQAVKKYSVGQTVTGKVTKITIFGAFVQLDENIHGLVHVSELSSKPFTDPTEIISVGDEKEFKILSIEPEDHRLGLSLKALEVGGEAEKPAAEAKTEEVKAEEPAKAETEPEKTEEKEA